MPRPSVARRALGGLGVLGGLSLLAAFVITIPAAWNTARLVLFCAGGIAVAVATFGSHATVSRTLALAGTVPIIAANAALAAWILVAVGLEQPFAGGAGLVGFWAGVAAWLGQALFGTIALRLGVTWRWAAVALAIGSMGAILGIDRLGLTSAANPTLAGPVSLAGMVLNGLAWVLLGLELAIAPLRSGRRVSGDPAPAAPAAAAGPPSGPP